MKGKKLLSMVTAGTLAATMAMPVMADGGEVTVNVTTKTAVLRVEVPTTMAIAVDQFMLANGGTDKTQISSSEFTMANKSEVDVKVSVTSTATLGAKTKLVPTKEGAASSMNAGEAWLGVAAKTAANSYDDTTTTDSETIASLTESNANVATFATKNNKTEAVQTFYMEKGDGDIAYKLLNAGEDSSTLNYSQFYKLTEATAVTDNDTLNALAATTDVYVGAKTAADGEALTLIAMGTSGNTYDGTNKAYYTADSAPTAKASLSATEKYVYGETENVGSTNGNAAFRYVGILSNAQEIWTNTDISSIKIAYNIVGVSPDKYGEVKDDCQYGIYVPTPPTISLTDITVAPGNSAAISVALNSAAGIKSIKIAGSTSNVPAERYSLNEDNDTLTIDGTFTNNQKTAINSTNGLKLDITFNDPKSTVIQVVLKSN